MNTRRHLNAALKVLDEMVFADPADLPTLNRCYEAAFARYATAARTETKAPACALCGCTDAPLDTLTNAAYACATHQYSLEHDDVLCAACRAEFEDEAASTVAYRHWSYLGY